MPRFIFTTLLLLLFASSHADNYIYPVATGTSWCREVFEEVEKAQLEYNREHPAPAGIPDFSDLFTRYYGNYKQFQLYEDSIFMDAPQKEWVAMFKRRDSRYDDIYADNNALLKSIEDYFSGDDVPDAAYDSLYFWTRRMYHQTMNDLFVIEELIDRILIPHYEKSDDYDHLELCYSYAGLTYYQFSRMGDPEAASRSLEYFQKAVGLSNHFATFKDPLNRFYLISSFVNLCVLHAEDGNIPLEKAVEIHGQMWELFLDRAVRDLLERDERLEEMAQWSLNLFCFRSIMIYISLGLDDEKLLDWLYWAYGEAKKNAGGSLINLKHRYYAKIEYDEPIIEATMGHITWNEAYSQFMRLHLSDPEIMSGKSMSVYRMNYMNNLFASHIYLIEQTDMTYMEKSVAVKRMLKYIFKTIKNFEHIQFPFEKGEIISNIATHPDVLKYLTVDEIRFMFYLLFVLDQPSSYVHVTMVAELTDLLTEALADEHPEYFSEVPHLDDPGAVQIFKDELIDYVHQSALYHDVGKISMPTIVNNGYRALTDHELSILRMHTEKSAPYFAISDDFKKYGVIAMGHHKWFNGEGYPESFNNTGRLLFPFLNIISLCDYMDEATVDVVRHTKKNFEEVIEELKAGAGTQFDPMLVDFICNNTDLYEKMKEKVYTSRVRHYYIMYRSFLDESLPMKVKEPLDIDYSLFE